MSRSGPIPNVTEDIVESAFEEFDNAWIVKYDLDEDRDATSDQPIQLFLKLLETLSGDWNLLRRLFEQKAKVLARKRRIVSDSIEEVEEVEEIIIRA